MKLSDLYEAIENLGPQKSFYFSDNDELNHYILKYNEQNKLWEYYFLDERGGKTLFKIFESEAKACEYVLLDAIRIIKDLRNAHMDAVRNKYLGEPCRK